MNKSDMLFVMANQIERINQMPEFDGREMVKKSIMRKIEFMKDENVHYTNDLLYKDAMSMMDWAREQNRKRTTDMDEVKDERI